MDRKSTTEIGTPDMVVFMPDGKTLILELKTRLGKCSPEQLGYHLELSMLNHKCHVIVCMDQFIELTKL